MVIPSYAYLKLKIHGLTGVITVEAKAQWALDCEHDNIKLATAEVTIAKLRELNLGVPSMPLDPVMPPTTGAFKAVEDAKVMQIDARDPTITMQIGVRMDPKEGSKLIDFLRRNRDIFVWSLVEMPSDTREVTENTLNIKPGSRPVKQGLQRFNKEKRRDMS
jgi:hypothetical protein